MTTETSEQVPIPAGSGAVYAAFNTLERVPRRFREYRFWITQVLVLGAVGAHYLVESAGITEPLETLHGISITIYIVPMLYASLAYGWEGAIFTALWGALLTTPSMWVWHRSEWHWLTEVAQLLVTLPVGMLVAWRVDHETRLRVDAEATSVSLEVINAVGSADLAREGAYAAVPLEANSASLARSVAIFRRPRQSMSINSSS